MPSSTYFDSVAGGIMEMDEEGFYEARHQRLLLMMTWIPTIWSLSISIKEITAPYYLHRSLMITILLSVLSE